jgi:hypothetical protein
MLFAVLVLLTCNKVKYEASLNFIRFIVYLAIRKFAHYIRKLFCTFYTVPLQQYYQIT